MPVQAVTVHKFGGPEVLDLVEQDVADPGPGELLVTLAAAGVNFVDVYHRTGAYPRDTPFVPGVEGAGTVTAVGDGVTAVSIGDRVAWADAPGSYAEQVLVRAERAVAVPDEVPSELAAAAMLQGMTAHYLTRSTYPIKAGDAVLIHAAAGGMGLLLTQLAKHAGARVIATVSTEEKERLARTAGADEVIRYAGLPAERLAAEVRRLTGGEGVAAVYDGVGAATFEASLASLRPRGVLASYGNASGPVPPVAPARLLAAGSVFLTRPSLGHYIATREELHERAGDVLRWVADGTLRIHIGGRYPLAEAAAAHADLEARRTTGKLLLVL